MTEAILDAVVDSLKLLPFLFLVYLVIEILEHNTGAGRPHRALTGKAAPLLGALLGTLPFCGFSVMAAKLYQHRHIKLGTLFAVFCTTSDEALIVLLLSDMGWREKLLSLLLVVAIKLAIALVFGYLFDALERERPIPLPEHAHDHGQDHDHAHGHSHGHDGQHAHGEEHGAGEHSHRDEQRGTHVREEGDMEHVYPHHDGEETHENGDCECADLSPCEHKHGGKVRMYLLSPLSHALKVFAFVLVVNLAFGILFEVAGEDETVNFLQGAGYWYQPLFCALIALVPNCASSVVITEVYALGGIGFGAFLGGLVTAAGLGYLALLSKPRRKEGILFLAGMFVLGVCAGYLGNAAALLF